MSARTAPMPAGRSRRDYLAHARAPIYGLFDKLLESATRLRGAIDAGRQRVSSDVVTGWCGEYVVHREFPELSWQADHNAIDFSGPGGRVEVKSTTAAQGGRLHLSEAQVQAVAGGSVQLRCVRVPEEVVARLCRILRDAEQVGPPTDRGWDVPLARLSYATGIPQGKLWGCFPAIQEAARGLEGVTSARWRGLAGEHPLSGAVWNALAEARAGLELPFT